MTLDDQRRCCGGTTRVAPHRVRRDCLDCARLRPFADEPGPDDIDPVGAWVDATAHREGYCRERRSAGTVTAEQVAGMDDMGAHAESLRAEGQGAPCLPVGGGDSAIHPDGGAA